jgi:4-hydroxybenzoate polyprenyltransferase
VNARRPNPFGGKAEAIAYLIAVPLICLALLTWAIQGDGVVLWVAVVVLPVSIFCGYLALRERRSIDKGDYLIEPRVRWRRGLILFGALLPQALRVLRGSAPTA